MNRSSSGLYNTLSLVFLGLTVFVFVCTLALFLGVIHAPGSFSPHSQVIPPTVVLPTSTITPRPSATEVPSETPLPTKTPAPTFTPVNQPVVTPKAQLIPVAGPHA